MVTKRKDRDVGAVSTAVEFQPLAVAIAQSAILGGVAQQVVRLLTGGDPTVQLPSDVVTRPMVQETTWDADAKEPEFSVPTRTPNEDDGELSKWLKTVRERRSSPKRKPKPASS